MKSPLLRYLGALALLGLAYYGTGRLGLLLAIPPGYATAVWPPSGIALAGILLLGYRAWPGVMLGSFGVNVFTSLNPASAETIARSMSVAAVIAMGAAAQAVAGAYLVRRFAGSPGPMAKESQIVAFLVLGGPVSCSISASVGAATLLSAGLLERAQIGIGWLTWWAGDVIGVIIFAPLILLAASERGETWLRTQLTIFLPPALGFAVVVALFVYNQRAERERADMEFDQQAERLAEHLEVSFQGYVEILRAVAGFMSTAPDVDRDRFSDFVEPIRARHPGILAISWNVPVRAGERAAYEERARRADGPGFQISELTGAGLARAGARAEHVVVAYIEPRAANAMVVGYDVASDPARADALHQARISGVPAATDPVHLVQSRGLGLLVFLPVYKPGAPLGTAEERARGVLGYVTAVFEIKDVFGAILSHAREKGLLLRLSDETRSRPGHLLYGSTPVTGELREDDGWDKVVALQRGASLNIAGRRWRLEMGLLTKDLIARANLGAWGILTGGLLFVGMLEAFLLLVTRRSAAIELLVAERTEKLSSVNANLAKEVTERKQAEKAAKVLEGALVQKNEELEEQNRRLEKATRLKSEFLANMSHELRTPLNAILGFSQLMRDGKLGPVTARQEQYLDNVLGSAEHLLHLINDVLDLAKVEAGKIEVRPARVDVKRAIAEVTDVLRPLLARSRIKLSVDVDPELGEVFVDREKLRQILYNYLSNAIKFTPAEGDVAVRVTRRDDMFRLEVRDSGPGIADEDLSRLFVEFQQLDPADGKPRGGTGLGLALTKRIVEAQGGSVGVRSTLGSSSVFYADLPRIVVGSARTDESDPHRTPGSISR
jgi:signal transduction histidine kinase